MRQPQGTELLAASGIFFEVIETSGVRMLPPLDEFV